MHNFLLFHFSNDSSISISSMSLLRFAGNIFFNIMCYKINHYILRCSKFTYIN